MLKSRLKRRWRATFPYELLSFTLIMGFILLGSIRTPDAYLRLFEALRDFGISIAYLAVPIVTPTVTSFSYSARQDFPRAIGDLAEAFRSFGLRFVSAENFLGYLLSISEGMYNFLYIFLIAFLLIVIMTVFFAFQLSRGNNKVGRITRPLRAVLFLKRTLYRPVKKLIVKEYHFFQERTGYKKAIIALAVLYLNGYTVLLEAFAYYFYFIFSHDVVGLGGQLIKLLWDLKLAFDLFPLPIWIVIFLVLFDKIRKRRAYRKLRNQEDKLRDFIDRRAVAFMVCAPMREGKTTLLTSIMMSLEKIFREQADKAIFEIKMRFTDFPWQKLEKFLNCGIKSHALYNLAGCRTYAHMLFETYPTAPKDIQRLILRFFHRRFKVNTYLMPDNLFGYDLARAPSVYRDGLGGEPLTHALCDFMQLYFIYANPTSLIVSNYNIRLDKDFETEGNYPRWKDDFFKREPSKLSESMNSHVLNQDMLRLGLKKDPNNDFNDAFEYGLVAQQEIGKERGNQYDLAGLSVQDKTCNQRTDYYDANIKLSGHAATIRYIPFIRWGADEQRPQNLAANAKDLFDIITIVDKKPDKILLPFFAIEEAAYLVLTRFIRMIYRIFTYKRADMTLIMWLLLSLYVPVANHYTRIFNTFGGYYLTLYTESGMRVNGETDPTQKEKAKIFISRKKVYSNRFDTASWRIFYDEKAKRSHYGLKDIDTYKDLPVQEEEMIAAHSHFFEKIMNLFKNERRPVKEDTDHKDERKGNSKNKQPKT